MRNWFSKSKQASGDVACCPTRRLYPSLPAVLGMVVLALLVAGASYVVDGKQDEGFPHQEHARLFPLCTGCHEGMDGSADKVYPSPELCARCHDGKQRPKVDWTSPAVKVSNLKFSHPAHYANEDVECEVCHTVKGTARMAVKRAVPDRCFTCHEGTNHTVDANCKQCHVPLANTKFTAARVSALPLPEDHKRPDFLLQWHGKQADAKPDRCSTCHTRDRCASCHVNAARVKAIGKIPAAPAGFPLGRMAARYPEPPSHHDAQWLEQHGGQATVQACSTCHTRESCESCHTQPTVAVVDSLPARQAGPAPGARVGRRMPASHAAKSFQTQHAGIAAAQPQQCETCHTKKFCEDCHNGPTTPSFHPRNFVAQHASSAYGRRLECATCHEVRTFCRSCHIQQGMGATGRLDSGFHDAQPVWLLRHAQAARQGLESCTSCHVQKDCLQCHSQVGAFKVNPHGPNFDAARVQKRNPLICFACHISDPLKKGTQP